MAATPPAGACTDTMGRGFWPMLTVMLVPLGALAALGGAYSSSTLPILAAAAGAFLISGAGIAHSRDDRALDLALLAFLAGVATQLMPLPVAVVALVSPQAPPLQDLLLLAPPKLRTLSIDPRLTREGLASAASAVLLFWAAREVFARGGVRLAAGTIACAGLAVALVATAQRADAPDRLLWVWQPLDPGARPFGPFVNRNHFAAWLLMAVSVTGGALAGELRAAGRALAPRRLALREILIDGRAPLLIGAAALMLAVFAAAGSRAAAVGAVAALVVGLQAGRGIRSMAARAAAITIVALAIGAGWLNRDVLGARIEETVVGRPIDRPVIWRETVPIVRDFYIAGTGLGTYARSMQQYQQTAPARLFNQAHNEYLHLLAEGGLVLALPAAAAAWLLTSLAWRRVRGDRDATFWARAGAAAGLVGIAVQSLFESPLRLPANALLCALLAALAVHGRPRDRAAATPAA